MDLIEGDDGTWMAVFLGVRPVFKAREVGGAMGMPTHLGRESFMAPMEWVDGWPVVNNRKPIELVGQAEGLTFIPEATSFVDNFDQKSRYNRLDAIADSQAWRSAGIESEYLCATFTVLPKGPDI